MLSISTVSCNWRCTGDAVAHAKYALRGSTRSNEGRYKVGSNPDRPPIYVEARAQLGHVEGDCVRRPSNCLYLRHQMSNIQAEWLWCAHSRHFRCRYHIQTESRIQPFFVCNSLLHQFCSSLGVPSQFQPVHVRHTQSFSCLEQPLRICQILHTQASVLQLRASTQFSLFLSLLNVSCYLEEGRAGVAAAILEVAKVKVGVEVEDAEILLWVSFTQALIVAPCYFVPSTDHKGKKTFRYHAGNDSAQLVLRSLQVLSITPHISAVIHSCCAFLHGLNQCNRYTKFAKFLSKEGRPLSGTWTTEVSPHSFVRLEAEQAERVFCWLYNCAPIQYIEGVHELPKAHVLWLILPIFAGPSPPLLK
mmetsp:Transcript_833/g.1540  ORF Transcript_833/g.1540 Transcript_833/m.1540 type:complete len:361 (+) Transcript_833:159-1241(+)